MKQISISILLLFCMLLCIACNPHQEANEDIETVKRFGDGRIQILAEWRTSVRDEIGEYEYKDTAYSYKYQCYKLYDQKLKYAIQYTLYDYYQDNDVIYSFGDRGYIKIDINSFEIDTYSRFSDIPKEIEGFDKLTQCCPVEKVCFVNKDYITTFATVSDEGEVFLEDNTIIDVLSQKRYLEQ